MLLPARHVPEGHLPAAPPWLLPVLLSRPSPWRLGGSCCALLQTKLEAYLNGTVAWWQQLLVRRWGSL